MKTSDHPGAEVWGRALLAAIPDLVFLLDRDARYVDVLATSDDQLAMPRERFIGRTVGEVMPASVAEPCMAAIRSLSREADVASFNYDLTVRGGEHRWFEGRTALCDPEHIVVIVRDFTDQRQAEEALRLSENVLAEAQRIAGLGSWEDDRKRMLLSWSDEIYHIFGVTPDTLQPSVEAFFEFVHPDDRSAVQAAFDALLEKKAPYDIVHRILLRDGETRWVHEQAECFYDADGSPTRIVGTTFDVTERILAEKELQEANATMERRAAQLRELSMELATVEQRERQHLATALHDNLQQLLVAAKYHVAAVAGRVNDDHLIRAARSAEEVLDTAISECRSLSIELRPPILREGGLARALEWLGRRMQKTHGLAVEVTIEEGAVLDQTLCTSVFNAVRELLLNVVKHAGVESVAVTMTFTPSGELCVVVADQGRGFDAAAIEAAEGHAGRFGLFAIHERLRALGGRFHVESAPGKGSRFTLTAPLPSAAPPSAKRADRPAAPDAQHGPPPHPGANAGAGIFRVLLVDDHQIVRQGLAQLLSQEPCFEVVGEAPDGETALSLVRQLQPDVVLMDLNMPGMNGVTATQIIHSEFPNIVVIGLSMYREDHRANEMRAAGAAAYLSKDEAAESVIATILSCCRDRAPA